MAWGKAEAWGKAGPSGERGMGVGLGAGTWARESMGFQLLSIMSQVPNT